MGMHEFFSKIVARYETEAAAGEHDDSCEFRANGHYVCNCAARKRIASGYTEPPEGLIFNNPSCPRCFAEVEHDGDSYRCEPCAVYWPDPDGRAEFFDDHGPIDIAAWDAAKAAS